MHETVKPIQYVESNANQILEVIRKNPNMPLKQIKDTLSKNGTFPNLSTSMLRQYLNSLNRMGYIQKMGVHIHTYKCLKDTPYTYTPVGWKYNRRGQGTILS
jgi:DNA-binding HxlR family transcriptional regulator